MKRNIFAVLVFLLTFAATAQPTDPGTALLFNGTNSYVSIATTGSLAGTFTVELWANPNHPTNTLGLVGSRNPGEYSFDSKFFNGNLIHGDIGNGSAWLTTSADETYYYATGTWSHIAYVVTPTNYTVYANGFQVVSSNYATANPVLYDSNHQLSIGWSGYAGSEFMNGQIDEVRIWNTARTASQIQTNSHRFLTGTEAGLMGYWRFDEGSGTTTADASGHGFSGTLVNGPAWVLSELPISTPQASIINFDDVTNGSMIDTLYVSSGVTFTNPITNTASGHIFARSGLGSAFSQPNVVSVFTGDTNSPNYSIFPFFDQTSGAVEAHFATPVRSVSIDVSPVGPLEGFPPYTDRPWLEGFNSNPNPSLNYLGGVYYSGPLPGGGGFSSGTRQTLTFFSPNNVKDIAFVRFASQNENNGPIYGFFDNLRFSTNLFSYRLLTSVIGQGSAVATPNQPNYTYGTVVTLQATAAPGWVFSSWSGDASGTANTLQVTMTADMNITANFVPVFSSVSVGLPGVEYSSAAWGDFDNDGKLDILLTGEAYPSGQLLSQVWRNLGNGVFTNINAGLPGVETGSAVFGDFDNDGNLDVLIAGFTTNTAVCQIWRNLGNGVFTNINAGLPGISYGSVAVGDFDNDGKLDILITGGDTNGNFISQIWRNLGNGTFTNINAGLPGLYNSSVALADFDNDGYLDILLTGESDFGEVAQVWRNLGNGTFTNINAGMPGDAVGSVAWGDFDNDGKLDILLTGNTNVTPAISQVWRNLGNNVFTNINAALPGVWYSSVAWGDFDNDGNPDILLTGDYTNNNISQVWRNLGNGTFANINAILPGVAVGSAAWGDFDNDGRLDILLTGASSNGVISQLFRNLTPVTNTAPVAPTGLAGRVTGTGVLLSWNAATDAQTPASGLSYNIRVGTKPGGFDVVSPESDPATGFRRLPQLGNAGVRLFSIVTNLSPRTTYYWSVQAVDTAFAGSPFAPEATFTITPSLFIQAAPPGQVVISWPSWATNYALQSTTNLLATNSWQTVTNVPSPTASWLYVTNRTLNTANFFRLQGH